MESRQLSLMGTVISLSLTHPEAGKILDRTEDMLRDYDRRFSANRDDSMLMRVNQAAGREAVRVDKDLFDLIRVGKEWSKKSNSRLNIAIGPLVKLWHIGFSDAREPDESTVQEAVRLVDPDQIILDEEGQTVYLKQEGMEIDLGCIAKGYFADEILRYWKQMGVSTGLIDLGGNVQTCGPALNHEDGFWRIGIQKPDESRGQLSAILFVKGRSVVTSGIYERHLTVGGRDFHHIIDSETGYPVQNDLASVTVVSPRSLDCEIWTTILFTSKSAEEALALAEKTPGIEAVTITKDDQVAYTSNLEDYIRVLDH